jgi:transposase InsO family protein
MAPSFGCTKLARKRERVDERRPTEKSRAVNTGAKMHRLAGAAIHQCWQKQLPNGRRRLLWFAMTRNPTAEWLARQITEAFPWERAPKYLISDNDRAFGVAFKARMRAMGILDRPTSFRSPWQNGYVERLIGSIRRECTDHLIVFNAEHLRLILAKYTTYYNEMRTHISLGKDAPYTRQIERFGDTVAHPILGGLHHRYARV